ncbi:hypothetical protein [Gloeobacter violaceus]|uniref:Gsr0184 protein n=1 Tax=Gloeobacter violaceus (strain ATCC 29082 / PCC 7421) TaxID=251221 RepID=Q7NP73_GLOVI|nr:hypothetical protein [Gloeobacter violaceus]BAC88125.1 gsr0184 [Gloeobacter violaceus PCC 7421]
MFLKTQMDGDLVEVLSIDDLFNPLKTVVTGRLQAGEEVQEIEVFSKAELVFPSGELLPRCWSDKDYRQTTGRSTHLQTA